MCLWKGQMSFWVYTIWKWAVFAWDILIQSTLSRLISLRSVIEHLHQVLWCTYNTVDQCFSNLVPRDPGVPRRRVRSSAKCWWKLGKFLCRRSRNYVSQIQTLRKFNCEYEVIFKNGVLHFQREFFGKKEVCVFTIRAFLRRAVPRRVI